MDLANCLHLHPPQALARVDDEVIALVISVGLGHAKAEARRFVHEGEFSQFTFCLGV
jgi:hypothetical protein